jgi:hypothetical protein
LILTAEIERAIIAHVLWKSHLHNAIERGVSEFTVEKVEADNLCEFGKWLFGLPAAERPTRHWQIVQQLHAEFHREAAHVLSLALQGRKAEAYQAVDLESLFMKTSAKLTQAMREWQQDQLLSGR